MNHQLIHPSSDVQSNNIGAGTRIWQFAVVAPGATIGENCIISSHCLIENDVVIGDGVTVQSGVQLWDGIRIGNGVSIGPNATFSNEHLADSAAQQTNSAATCIEDGASIGAGAIIFPGITIGRNSMIGAGAVVRRSVPANAIVVGNPAKIVGYVETPGTSGAEPVTLPAEVGSFETKVGGVTLHRMPHVADIRGSLTVGEFERSIPFPAKRYFIVFDVPSAETRGEHAHRECHQFLICVRGSCAVVADDGVNRQEFTLDSPDQGIYLRPMVWGIQYKYSSDAVLLVFASHYYDSADYIRDYTEFCELVETIA